MKPFKETKVGGFLAKVAPAILDVVGESCPPLKIVQEIITNSKDLDEKNKLEAIELLSLYEEEMEFSLTNTQGARDNYTNAKDTADLIAIKVINWNMILACLLVLVGIVSGLYLDNMIITVVNQIIGVVIGGLINERQTILNFYHGSSFKK